MNVQVDMSWQSMGEIALDGDALVVPGMPPTPGIHQWVFHHDGRERRYVGEAVDLRRRFAHYRSPGPSQTTNHRMRDRVRRVLGAGGTVELLQVKDANFVVDGKPAKPDLHSPFARRVLENAALVALLASRCETVNGEGYGELRMDEVLR